ncbi:MAG: M48 family metalloprotease [Pseudomonadota bacterium]|nr:M48 family metalloprotease [Pseudomonadota bacterium]
MLSHYKFLQLSFSLLLVISLSGCSVNPATGDQSFTGLMSLNDEIRIGREEHAKILKSFGGRYDDETLASYVSRIGNQLAAKSELPNLKWTFTVLNSPVINALALPGGYVYVTRGLMALASNEAELAGVLAHEIGHITARHTAQRYSSSMLAGGLSIAANIFLGSTAGDLANFASKAAIQSYSRKQEFEADTLGVRYLSRSNYNTSSMATFLNKLRAHSQLEAKRHKKDPASVDRGDMFATHPRTIDRVERAINNTRFTESGFRTGTVDYMEHLHNMLYGDDPKEGLIKGQSFIHPEMRFRFKVPRGFRLFNNPQSVIGKGPKGALIQFDTAKKPFGGSVADYISKVWARNNNFARIESINVNGMSGATAKTQIRKKNRIFDLRLTAVKYNNSRIYRFLFLTHIDQTKKLDLSLRRTTYSLRNISRIEARKIRTTRILVKAVNENDSVTDFIEFMDINSLKEETFRVINGLKPSEKLQPGKLIKVISE